MLTRLARGAAIALVAPIGCGCASMSTAPREPTAMSLGNFSVSLSVKDLAASRAFYEKLGFTSVGGDGKGWVIMQSPDATIGLFQGMFQGNILTFNPGWDRNSKALPMFMDVRDIQGDLRAKGFKLVTAADEKSSGPASFMVTDPDGNMILVDQHVDRPKK